MTKLVLAFYAVILCAGAAFGQQNNQADTTNNYRYYGSSFTKVVRDQYGDGTAFNYFLSGQPHGRNWSTAVTVYSLRNGSNPVDVQVTRRFDSGLQLALASTFGQHSSAMTAVDYSHRRFGIGVVVPLGNIRGTEVGARYTVTDHWMAFASANPSGESKFGLGWHNGRDRIDLTVSGDGENLWSKWGHRVSSSMSLEVRARYDTRNSGNRMIGLGICYSP